MHKMICILSEVVQHSLLIASEHCSTQPEATIHVYSRLPGSENAMYSRKVETVDPFIYHDDGGVGRISWKVAKTSTAQQGPVYYRSSVTRQSLMFCNQHRRRQTSLSCLKIETENILNVFYMSLVRVYFRQVSG